MDLDQEMDSEQEPAVQEPVISVRGATAALGSRPVLRGVDLTVHRGEVVALLGANGSGKSTAVRAVIGQVPLTGGSIELFGSPLGRFRQWARIGYVPQRTTAAAWGARDGAGDRLVRPASRVRSCDGRPEPTAPPWPVRSSWWGSATGQATPWARSPAASTSGC